MSDRRTLHDIVVHIDVTEYILTTMGLSTAQHGSLLFLTMAAMQNDGWLPAYEKGLARLARCTPRQWKRDREALAQFFEITGERWTHRRRYIGKVKEIYLEDGRLGGNAWQALRARIFERDGHACTYCGAHGVALHCDHIVPVSRGGTNAEANLTTACQPCNQSKHAKTPDEWRAAAQ